MKNKPWAPSHLLILSKIQRKIIAYYIALIIKNDIFVIRNIEFYPDNDVYIYNRWGEELLNLKAYDNSSVRWRGENKDGDNLPEGTYYVVAIINVNGADLVLKGHVDIRR